MDPISAAARDAGPPPTAPEGPSAAVQDSPADRRRALTVVFWLWPANCLIAWAISLQVLAKKEPASIFGNLHLALAFMAHYAAIQALIIGALLGAAALLPRRWLLLWLVPPLLALAHLYFYIDPIVLEYSGEHFNLRALLVILSPGIGASIPFSPGQYLKAAGLVLGIAAILHFAARGLYRLTDRRPSLPGNLGRHAAWAAAVLAAGLLVESGMYAYADIRSRTDVLVNAQLLAFYQPVTCQRMAKRLGIQVEREYRFGQGLGLRYPLSPVAAPEHPRKLNVLWIAVEGWRHDAFSPELTPHTWRFAQHCLIGDRHYSTGNTTRFGIFGMFYGLNGLYWQPFLAARQGPLMIRMLQDMGYDFRAMGSANFVNPEFRLTCFAELPEGQILDRWPKQKRSEDRDEAMIDKFREYLASRDPAKPFFAFLFLDSSHSYHFKPLPGFTPPLQCDRQDFVSYEKMASDQAERDRAHARYLNSIAYSDFLIGRALADLEQRGLLDSTVVMIAGDHGEEFGEAGHAGHNTAFHDWQVRTPFVFHYPGVKPGRVARMTSHADWAPTVLKLLGVEAPPGQYCQGLDMLGPEERTYAVASGYSKAGIITAEGRLAFPFAGYRLSTTTVYDPLGRPLADPDGFRKRMQPLLDTILRSSQTFRR